MAAEIINYNVIAERRFLRAPIIGKFQISVKNDACQHNFAYVYAFGGNIIIDINGYFHVTFWKRSPKYVSLYFFSYFFVIFNKINLTLVNISRIHFGDEDKGTDVYFKQ